MSFPFNTNRPQAQAAAAALLPPHHLDLSLSVHICAYLWFIFRALDTPRATPVSREESDMKPRMHTE